MVEDWYCEIAGREVGPLTAQQLRAMAVKGQILPSDCIRPASQTQWMLARQVRGLFPDPTEAAPSGRAEDEKGRGGEGGDEPDTAGSDVSPSPPLPLSPSGSSSPPLPLPPRWPPLPVAQRIAEPGVAPAIPVVAPPVAIRPTFEGRPVPPPLARGEGEIPLPAITGSSPPLPLSPSPSPALGLAARLRHKRRQQQQKLLIGLVFSVVSWRRHRHCLGA